MADGGAAASSEDFFRSPAYLRAEAVTHSLMLGSEAALPLLVRPIPGSDLRDGTSPYGYPGGVRTRAEPIDPAAVDWSPAELVSLFLRDRVGDVPLLEAPARRRVVQVADPTKLLRLRKDHRYQVGRNARLGYRTRRTPGPQTTGDERASFGAVYAETMLRAGAEERYFFPAEYFETLLESQRSWLLLTRSPDGRPAAGAIAVLSDGMLHDFLRGTGAEFVRDSPAKSTLAEMIELARELGVPLNLGGGVNPGDSLEDFKSGFANTTAAFHMHEIVCDRAAYDELSPRAEVSDFFPAYRA